MAGLLAAGGGWIAAEWLLFAAWAGAALLGMFPEIPGASVLRGGFLTSHLADLTLPAWLYVRFRRGVPLLASRWWGRTPATAAAALFVASAATEVSQLAWPRGLFRGTFDPLDLVAYGAGLLAVFVADLRWPVPTVHANVGSSR